MKTGLLDLNDLLFEQLERLGNDDLTGEELESEINRSKAVSGIASQIITNGHLVLKSLELKAEYSPNQVVVPKMLTGQDDEED